MKTTYFARAARFFFKTCTNPTLIFLLRRFLEVVDTKNQFYFFSESELGCGPQDSVGKLTYIIKKKKERKK